MNAAAMNAIRKLAEAEAELLALGVAPSRQNFTGSIGEWLVANAMGGKLLPTNTKDGDVLLPCGRVAEVKTVKSEDGSTSFMRNFDPRQEEGKAELLNELLILVVLDPNTNGVLHALELGRKEINECKSYNSRTKSYVVSVKKALANEGSINLKEKHKWH
jgi:hypothetical protein